MHAFYRTQEPNCCCFFSIIPLEEKKSIEKNKSDNKMHFAREHSQWMFCYTFYLLIFFF